MTLGNINSELGTIHGLMASIQDYAKGIVAEGDTLVTMWRDLGNYSISVSSGGIAGISPTEPDAPTLEIPVISIDPLTATVPDIGDPPEPLNVDIPVFTTPAPGINIPDSPDTVIPDFNIADPTLTSVQVPTPISVDVPTPPTFESLNIPAPPRYSLPTFTFEAPVADLTAPETNFYFHEAMYDSDLMRELSIRLLEKLQEGGTGLGEDVEEAIYERANRRMEVENQRMYDNALYYFQERGHMLPPGMLSHQLIVIDKEIAAKRDDVSRDIMISQAELAQQNTFKIIEQAMAWEGLLVNKVNTFQDRALAASKALVETSVLLHKAKIDAYQSQILVYDTLAKIYEVTIRGELAKAQFYHSQIEGVKASADVQQSVAQVYVAQLAGVNALVDIYRAQMEGARVQSDINRNIIALYAEQVDAFGARVAAVGEQYKVYQAQLMGEKTKADVYTAEVGAYAERVRAGALTAEVNKIANENYAIQLDAEIKKFSAEIDIHRARLAEAVEIARVKAQQNGMEVELYKAEVGNYSAELQALLEELKTRVSEAEANARLAIATANINIREINAQLQSDIETINADRRATSQITAAQLGQWSESAHISKSESHGNSESASTSVSNINQTHRQDQTLLQHIYEH